MRHTIPLLSLLFAASAFAQDLVPIPQQLPIFVEEEYRKDLDFEIYPLGWSENGEQLATLIAQPNEAADERAWELRIVDLVTDETILAETIRHPHDGTLGTFWNKHGEFVQEQLENRGIQRSTFELRRFPALLGRFGSDVYEFVLARNYAVEPNFGYQGLNELTVTVIRNGVKSKRVLEKEWPEFYPLAAGVAGYLPSPTGDRIAMLLVLTQRGYEGAPHPRNVKLIGSRVGSNF